MLPGDKQKGPSSKSQLFESLRVYLDKKDRLQPIIGLGSVIECVKAGAQALYLCEVCICRLSKSDMRNHIMGSLHRYNYINSWYPHLMSGWKESSDLSKLARPLMDMAKILEGQEGPGDVQLIEVEDDVYQKISTHGENDAITLISSLRAEPESSPETSSSQSQRIVLLAKRPQRQPGKAFKPLRSLYKTKYQVLFEKSSLSGRNSCFFEGYTGTKPLIGLCCVVECQNEAGQTCGFLCHCCRTRPKKGGITYHLTSTSHVYNYLMEAHPEKVKFVNAADESSRGILESLAEKVEEDEGRGNPKVVTAPESICTRMEKKSYNWCVRMLCKLSIGTNYQQQEAAVDGPFQGVPYVPVQAVAPSNWTPQITTGKRKKKSKKATKTVFNVSLPFTDGALLLERSPFSNERVPMCAYSPSSHPAASPSPESQTEGPELFVGNHTDHTSACGAAQLQPDVYNNEGGAWQYVAPKENLRVSVYPDVERSFWGNEEGHGAVAQSKTGTEGQVSAENLSGAAWHHYQQPQYSAPGYVNLTVWQATPPGVGHHGSSDEMVPYVDASRVATYPSLGYSQPHAAPQPRARFHGVEQRQLQPYMEFTERVHAAPHVMTPAALYQDGRYGYGFTADPNYHIRPRTNDNQPFPDPAGGFAVRAVYQPNAHVPPWAPLCYTAQSM
ncbi:uncharacterized protein LOC114865300 isoform X2 [Betta splendens]|uniref:Uncharacterized protein LOC114865300 isoform X2 n=1 Tax=Betta splendens TaxID=158456 RepID=A0A6P7NQF3_BETSP|nr:uncharacterized protein LOC114865300 isoform X2 [Betta splendens]XP_029022132.1 uncharacterized protein LOC114865300 isoform X2 [Betta splendens]XP_029022133.1 uncharacterized protein LOC114865300 isoform X2 [Betta splendens]